MNTILVISHFWREQCILTYILEHQFYKLIYEMIFVCNFGQRIGCTSNDDLFNITMEKYLSLTAVYHILS